MKNNDELYDGVIEEYYNELDELPEKIQKEISAEKTDLVEKLTLSLDKMNILNNDISDFPLDIMEIINAGEEIKKKKRALSDFLLFISTSLLLISSVVFITIFINQNFFIYFELLTFVFIPIIIIPMAKLSFNGGAS